jgi:hypothetical protein
MLFMRGNKAADKRRHHHEEHHDEAVGRDEDVERLRVREDLHARLLELEPHADGQCTTDETREEREDQVQRADVLVVG